MHNMGLPWDINIKETVKNVTRAFQEELQLQMEKGQKERDEEIKKTLGAITQRRMKEFEQSLAALPKVGLFSTADEHAVVVPPHEDRMAEKEEEKKESTGVTHLPLYRLS